MTDHSNQRRLSQKSNADRANVLHSITDRLLEKYEQKPSTSAPLSTKYQCHPCAVFFPTERELLEHTNICGRNDAPSVNKAPAMPVKVHTPVVVGRKMMAMRECGITDADDESLDTSSNESVVDASKSALGARGRGNKKNNANKAQLKVDVGDSTEAHIE